jgi:lysophospholipase L1-like esterase
VKKTEFGLLSVAVLLSTVAFYRFSANQLNAVTGLVLLAAIFAFAFFVAETSLRLLDRSTEIRNQARLLLGTITFIVVALELFLRFGTAHYSTYQERVGNDDYVSVFDQNWFTATNAYPPHDSIIRHRSEFTHVRTTNSLGLAERRIPLTTRPGEYRVVALGDSYTEGMGTVYDSTWVNVAQRHLATLRPNDAITFINGGIAGSDVHSAYMLLKDRLLQLAPDLVVIATNASDVTDVVIRGGMERFQPDGAIITKSGPRWEPVYAVSFVFRFWIRTVLGYNHVFVKNRRSDRIYAQAVGEIREAIDSIAAIGIREGFATMVVLHPVDWESQNDRWSFGYDKLALDLEQNDDVAVLDLLEYYRSHELTTPDNVGSFFWPIDGHYNATGYRAMGEAVAETIQEFRLLNEAWTPLSDIRSSR